MNAPARTLLAGWFSFSDKKATFGDVQAMEVVAGWLRAVGYVFDVAGHPAGGVEGLDISKVDPSRYDTFIFICGPWGGGESPLLKAFSHCRKIGINLSVAEGKHGFDCLYPRDSSTERNPDLVFAATSMAVPVIGVALVHAQPMFRERQRHEAVAAAVEQFVRESGAAVIKLDTLTDNNTARIPSVRQLETLIRRVDVMISSRLNGAGVLVFIAEQTLEHSSSPPKNLIPARIAAIRRERASVTHACKKRSRQSLTQVNRKRYQAHDSNAPRQRLRHPSTFLSTLDKGMRERAAGSHRHANRRFGRHLLELIFPEDAETLLRPP